MTKNRILNLTRSVLTLQVGERVVDIEGEVYLDGAFVASRSSLRRCANGDVLTEDEKDTVLSAAAAELAKRKMFLEIGD